MVTVVKRRPLHRSDTHLLARHAIADSAPVMSDTLGAYLDPQRCPDQRPQIGDMHPTTRRLHEAIDRAAVHAGQPFLHPEDPTVQLDLLGSAGMQAWQEGKVEFAMLGEGCWSSLPQVYARYGTELTRSLLREVQRLESAAGALLTDCGMQATAMVLDVLLQPNGQAVMMRQVYNKSLKYLQWLAQRLGADVRVVDDGDYQALAEAITPATTVVYAETFTNPLVRAQDPEALVRVVSQARERAPDLRLVVDTTIATPWGFKKPLLELGVDIVVASGTKALGGQDRDMWGYIAANDLDTLNALMDLQAMRGGILDWRRARAICQGLALAQTNFDRRCAGASKVAAFLQAHPRVEVVYHPSLASHPDRAVIERHYRRPGSLLSFRLRDADEQQARHFCDVLATTGVPRYALSFDGLVTKVNHHKTVSEYFTPDAALRRAGIDRLVRLGVGVEAPEDIIACLNWALWHAQAVSAGAVAAWQQDRRRARNHDVVTSS